MASQFAGRVAIGCCTGRVYLRARIGSEGFTSEDRVWGTRRWRRRPGQLVHDGGEVSRRQGAGRRRHWSYVGICNNQIVVPLEHIYGIRVAAEVQGETNQVNLKRVHVTQSKILEISDQVSVDPNANASITKARGVGLDHHFVAIPLVQIGDEVGARDKKRAKIAWSIGAGQYDAIGKPVIAVGAALLRVICVDVRKTRIGAGEIATVFHVDIEFIGAIRGYARAAIL